MAKQTRRVVAIAGRKGGTGKTTTAANVAGALAEAGEKVLLIDADSQGSLSLAFGFQDDGAALLAALVNGDPLPVVSTAFDRVDLAPGGFHLADTDRLEGNERSLTDALAATAGPWRWVLIDTAPALGILTLSAIAAADFVLAPVEASPLSLAGLRDLTATLSAIRPELAPLILPSRCSTRRALHREVVEKLRQAFPGKVGPEVRESVQAAEAPGFGKPVTTYAPRSGVADDFRNVAAWLKRRKP